MQKEVSVSFTMSFNAVNHEGSMTETVIAVHGIQALFFRKARNGFKNTNLYRKRTSICRHQTRCVLS